MASRKNLVLASLVSLVMVLSFGVGLVPMLTVSPDQSAKAAPGDTSIAISVDGASAVGASYAMPVGSEQGFTALQLVGGAAQTLAAGQVEWSLATDGSAQLVGGAGDAVATVRASAPGEAGLYVRTADGQVDVVNLSFYALKANGAQVSTVTVTAPPANSRILVPADAAATPVTFTAETDAPGDVLRVRYAVDAAQRGYSEAAPYPLALPDLAVGAHTVTASAWSVAQSAYVNSAATPFTVAQALSGDADGNGLPDDPFAAGLEPGDQWIVGVDDGTFNRQVGITLLDGQDVLKAVPLPAGGTTLTLADPADSSRWVRVTAPAGLVQADQQGLLVVTAADDFAGLLGGEAANLPAVPGEAVPGGRVANINILVQNDGSTDWTNLDNTLLADSPIVVEIGGLGVTAGESASLFVHPTTVSNPADPEIVVTMDNSEPPVGLGWDRPETGTAVDEGLMSAELTTLGTVVARALPGSPNIVSVTNVTPSTPLSGANAFSIGGDILEIEMANLQAGDTVAVEIDGETVASTLDGTTVTVTAPAAAALLAAADSAGVSLRVDVSGTAGDDFDALPQGLTYVGPQLTSVTPGSIGAGGEIQIQGVGIQASPLPTVTLDGVALNVVSATATSITARLTSLMPDLGIADLEVVNANNYSGSVPAAILVAQAAPVLNAVFPDAVYNDAEYALQLTGSNFVPSAAKSLWAGAQVYFSLDATTDPATDTAAASVEVLSSQAIRAKTPVGLAPNVYNVYVATLMYTAETGTPQAPLVSALTAETVVTVLEAGQSSVSISAVEPGHGPISGGTEVTITGAGFPEGAVPAVKQADSNVLQLGSVAVIYGTYNTDVDMTLFRGPDAGPLGGPAGINTTIQYDPDLLTFDGFTPSPELGLWYGKSASVTVQQKAVGLLEVTVNGSDTEITTFDNQRPEGTGEQLNPFPLGSFAFVLKLNESQSTQLTFGAVNATDENGQPFAEPFSTVDGSVAAPTALQMPKVFFGAVEAQVVSSTATTIQAVTPASDFHGVVDVRVENPNLPGPANFAIAVDAFEYTEPLLQVSPLDGFEATGPQGGAFTSTKTYTLANLGFGPVDWTVAVSENWITVTPAGATLAEGASQDVVLSINENANALDLGLYTATVTFDDGDSDTSDATLISVTLTVQEAGTPILQVSPDQAFTAGGFVTGPFAPGSFNYNVENVGDGTLNWTVSDDAAWLDVSPASGTATNSNPAPVVATINAAAESLGVGQYVATLTFSDGTATVIRTITLNVNTPPPPQLQVDPAGGFAASGKEGGPFAPESQTYTITNAGMGDLTWTASLGTPAPAWVTLTQDTDDVQVAIDPAAAATLEGTGTGTTYEATLTIVGNGGAAGTVERPIRLTVFAPPSIREVLPANVAPATSSRTIYLSGADFVDPAIPGLNGSNRVFFTTTAGAITPGADREAVSVTFISTSLLEVKTPLHDAGVFDVYVESSATGAGGTVTQLSQLATFIFADPTLGVDSVVPNEGPIEGDTPVTVNGSGFPVVSGTTAKMKQDITTGTVLRIADVNYNVYGTQGQIRVPFTLFRGPELPVDDGPASISGTFLYDPAVLQFVSGTRDSRLQSWYDKGIEYNLVQPGMVTFVVAAVNYNEITTWDNQIPTDLGDPEDPGDDVIHDPNAQTNPFPLGALRFNVLTQENITTSIDVYTNQDIGDVEGIYPLTMVDSTVPTPVTIPAQYESSTVTITEAAAQLQLEDVSITEGQNTFGVGINLFRPAGSNLTVGPAGILAIIDYDQSAFEFLGADPSELLQLWYGKNIVVDDDGDRLTVSIADPPVKAGAEITSVDNQRAEGTGDTQNPFPLGTLQFGVREGADLSQVDPFTVVDLTMTDKLNQPFPGSAGIGEVGVVEVTQLPLVFFGPYDGDVQSSTATAIAAITPVGVRRGPVDVTVMDPAQVITPDPTRPDITYFAYGVLIDGFTYLQPLVRVAPEDNFVTQGTLGGTVFTPPSKAYTIYNDGNGILTWAASADQTWVSLDVVSGSVGGSPDLDTVNVSIDDVAASALDAGVYTANVTFSTNAGDVIRTVTLTILGNPQMTIAPDAPVTFAGIEGGSFTLTSETGTFLVANDGTGLLNWTASVDQYTAPWVTLTPAAGTVNQGEAADEVAVTLNAAANALTASATPYVATITFEGDGGQQVTREVRVRVVAPGQPVLAVAGDSLVSSGPQGGPFDPTQEVFAVSNTGGGFLNYAVSISPAVDWLTVVNGAGQIAAGDPANNVSVQLNANAAALAASATPYEATIQFRDTDSNEVVERAVSLTVFALTVTDPNGGEEFERGDDVDITWTYGGPTDINQAVRIELLEAQTAGNVFVLLIAEQVYTANGTYTWTVPESLSLSRDYLVQVSSTTDNRATDTSDATFSVVEPVFDIVSPVPGDQVQGGEPFTIEWFYYEVGEPAKINEVVDIFLYRGDEQVGDEPIVDDATNNPFDLTGQSNTVVWNVPEDLPSGDDYRIVFKNQQGEIVAQTTPGAGFEIIGAGGGDGGGIIALLAGLVAALLGLAGGGGGGGGGGPCFIATAAYGTPMADQIDTLREFRDLYLLSNPLGMAAADAYYHVSPAIADLVAKSPVLAGVVRLVLMPVIVAAKVAVAMPGVALALTLVMGALLTLRRYARSRKA